MNLENYMDDDVIYSPLYTNDHEISKYGTDFAKNEHQNDPIVNLMELPDSRRLRRHLPNDLPTRFLV
jgi:hypothetical protein